MFRKGYQGPASTRRTVKEESSDHESRISHIRHDEDIRQRRQNLYSPYKQANDGLNPQGVHMNEYFSSQATHYQPQDWHIQAGGGNSNQVGIPNELYADVEWRNKIMNDINQVLGQFERQPGEGCLDEPIMMSAAAQSGAAAQVENMTYLERTRQPDDSPSQPGRSGQTLPAPRGVRVINPENIQGGHMSVSGFTYSNLTDLGKRICVHHNDTPRMAEQCLIESEPQARVQQYRMQQSEPLEKASYPQYSCSSFIRSPLLASVTGDIQPQQHHRETLDVYTSANLHHDTETIPDTVTQPKTQGMNVDMDNYGQAEVNTCSMPDGMYPTYGQEQLGISDLEPIPFSPGYQKPQIAGGNGTTDDRIADPVSSSATVQQALLNGEGRSLTLDEIRFRYNHLKRVFDTEKSVIYKSMRDPAYVADDGTARKCYEMTQRKLILAQMEGCINRMKAERTGDQSRQYSERAEASKQRVSPGHDVQTGRTSFQPIPTEALFRRMFLKWCRDRQISFNPRMMAIGDRQVDPYQLLTEIYMCGGPIVVMQNNLWGVIAANMGLAPAMIKGVCQSHCQITEQLNALYLRWLAPFEQNLITSATMNRLVSVRAQEAQRMKQTATKRSFSATPDPFRAIKSAYMSVQQMRASGYPEAFIQHIENSRSTLQDIQRRLEMLRTRVQVQPVQTQMTPSGARTDIQRLATNVHGEIQNLHTQPDRHDLQPLHSQAAIAYMNGHDNHGLIAESGRSNGLPDQQVWPTPQNMTTSNVQMNITLSNLQKPTEEAMKYASTVINQMEKDVSNERRLLPSQVKQISDDDSENFSNVFGSLYDLIGELHKISHIYLAATRDVSAVKSVLDMLDMCDKQQQLIVSVTPVYVLDIEMLQNLTKVAVEIRTKFNLVLEQLRAMWEHDQESRARSILIPLVPELYGQLQNQCQFQFNSTQFQTNTDDNGHPGAIEESDQSTNEQKPIQLTAQALENALEVIGQLKQELSNGQTFDSQYLKDLSTLEANTFPGLFKSLFEDTKEVCGILHTYLALTADVDLVMTVLDVNNKCDKQQQLLRRPIPAYVMDVGLVQQFTKMITESKAKCLSVVHQLRGMGYVPSQ